MEPLSIIVERAEDELRMGEIMVELGHPLIGIKYNKNFIVVKKRKFCFGRKDFKVYKRKSR